MTLTNENAPAAAATASEGNDRTANLQEEGTTVTMIAPESTQRTGWQFFDDETDVSPVFDSEAEAMAWVASLPIPTPGLTVREVDPKPLAPIVEWATEVRIYGGRNGDLWEAEAVRTILSTQGLPVVEVFATYELLQSGWKGLTGPKVHVDGTPSGLAITDPKVAAQFGAAIGTAGLVLSAITGGTK